MSPDPRVLLMAETYHPVLGGGEKHTRSLALGLVHSGFRVDVVTRRSSDDLKAIEDDGGVTIHRVGAPGQGRGKKFGMVPAAYQWARRLARESDVLMNGGTRVLALPARLAVAGTRCALVLRPELNGELDGSLALWGRKASRFEHRAAFGLARARNAMLSRTDAVVAISRAIAEEAVTAGFDAPKVHLIPHGIDMTEYAPAASLEAKASLRRSLGLPVDRTLVTYTGRLIQGKGLETLLAAARSLADIPSVHFVLVGSGSGQVISIEDALRAEAAADTALAGRVTFTGRVENVAAYLQASDVFAFPTLDEALGMSAVEAQACGLPAVASRTGGVPDIIEDGLTGVLVTPGDAGELASGLRRLLTDDALRIRFAQAARVRTVERFAYGTMVTRYAELFRGVIARRQAS